VRKAALPHPFNSFLSLDVLFNLKQKMSNRSALTLGESRTGMDDFFKPPGIDGKVVANSPPRLLNNGTEVEPLVPLFLSS